MTPLQSKLAEIEKRVKKASPGPWQVNGDHFPVCSTGNGHDGEDYSVCLNGYAARDGIGMDADAKTDAAFIAHSRQDIPFLLSALQEALGVVEHYKSAHYDNAGHPCYADRTMDEALERIERLAGGGD